MKFIFLEKNETETEILTDILAAENIRYSVKLVYINYNEKFYNISINVEPEKYFYIEYLLKIKYEPYRIAEKAFEMDEYIKDKEETNVALKRTQEDIRKDLEEACKVFFEKGATFPLPTGHIDIVIPIKKKTTFKDKFMKWIRGE